MTVERYCIYNYALQFNDVAVLCSKENVVLFNHTESRTAPSNPLAITLTYIVLTFDCNGSAFYPHQRSVSCKQITITFPSSR
jgi:hypothetical protein